MKRKLKKIRRYLMSKEYDGFIYKATIIFMYKLWLVLKGRYSKVKENLVEIIEKNVSTETFANKKFVNKTINDILYCKFNYGIKYEEYFIYSFHLLSHEGRKKYVGLTYNVNFYKKVNNKSYMEYFNIKSEAYRKFKKYYNRELIALYDERDSELLKDFISRHTKFIRKPVDDYGGHGVKIFNAAEYETSEELFRDVMDHGMCVVEELIVQSNELAQLHPQSVNTVRIVSFRESSEKVNIAWCFLRMGMGGSNVDNMSSGGMAVMVDPQTGIAYTTGRDYLNNIHIYHPDTGVQLVGFKLPDWDELLKMLVEVANVLPEVRWVGWDFAHTDKGWVFVEGNSRPGTGAAQVSEFNGKKELFEYMEEIFDKQNNERC